jgi:hypothetical protein
VRYAASRSVALLLTVLVAIAVRSRAAVVFIGIAMTLVQGFDGVIGMLARDVSKTYGPFAFVLVNAIVVARMLQEMDPFAATADFGAGHDKTDRRR